MSVLEARGLSCGYQARRVVSGVDLDLEAGEVYALIGPNGSGKTTLFRTLSGAIPPLAGSVRIAGRNPRGLQPKERACLVARVIQAERPSWPFEARDAVAMGLYARSGRFARRNKEQEGFIDEILEKVGIASMAKRKVTELSGGEFQLVLIARALVQRPRLLLLDEPVANLDVGNQVVVLELIRRIAKEEVAVAASLHDLNLASIFADRVGLVSEGKLKAQGRPGEVLAKGILETAYGTELLIAHHPESDIPLVTVPRRPRG
jgi:iron complex transport system ATP-binding protein